MKVRVEDLIRQQFRLLDGCLVRVSAGLPPSLGHGVYPQVALATGSKSGMKIAAHRVVFLLSHGWMPRMVEAVLRAAHGEFYRGTQP